MVDIATLWLFAALASIGLIGLHSAARPQAQAWQQATRALAWSRLTLSLAFGLLWFQQVLPHAMVLIGALLVWNLGLAAEAVAMARTTQRHPLRQWGTPTLLAVVLLWVVSLVAGLLPAYLEQLAFALAASAYGVIAWMWLRSLREAGAEPMLRLLPLAMAALNGLCFLAAVLGPTFLGTHVFRGATNGSGAMLALGVALMVQFNSLAHATVLAAKVQQERTRLANTDGQTAALNRRSFFEQSTRIAALARRQSQPVGLMLVDIDHLKDINEVHGIEVGDEVIRSVVATVAQLIRASDLLGRLGGEEFAVLLPATDVDGVVRAAERVRKAVAALRIQTRMGPLDLTVSAGVAMLHGQESLEEALARAEAALFFAKQQGRNQVSVSDVSEAVVAG